MRLFKSIILAFFILISFKSKSQTLDTLVDVGGYKLHFNIIKGKGVPILFEAGAGDDGSVWNGILPTIAKITGTTIITYDREGFGKSEIDTNEIVDKNHGIEHGIVALEVALKKLGYDKKINLVAHSFGGMYVSLYAVRHPDLVNSIVFIDANHAMCVTGAWIESFNKKIPKKEKSNLGMYYLNYTWANAVSILKQKTLPAKIPIIDMVAEFSSFPVDWNECHKQFADAHPGTETVLAKGCSHYIFLQNPSLVIQEVTKAFCSNIKEKEKTAVQNRYFTISEEILNKDKGQSEDEINAWGYLLLNKGEIQKAVEVFKLNVFLHPESWNAYDSYAEALLKDGQKEESKKMYQKSIELKPKN